jgi:hypothetical protein
MMKTICGFAIGLLATAAAPAGGRDQDPPSITAAPTYRPPPADQLAAQPQPQNYAAAVKRYKLCVDRNVAAAVAGSSAGSASREAAQDAMIRSLTDSCFSSLGMEAVNLPRSVMDILVKYEIVSLTAEMGSQSRKIEAELAKRDKAAAAYRECLNKASIGHGADL